MNTEKYNIAIRRARETAKLLPIHVANEADMELNIYRGIEAGSLVPTEEELSNICEILNINKENLYLEDQERTKILSIFNAKGGVGKTTTVITLAAALARKGKKVLCVDVDGQCSLSMAFEADLNSDKNIYSLFASKDPFSEDASQYILPTKVENIDIICGNGEVESLTAMLANVHSKEYILHDSLSRLVNANIYDFIIFDNAPSSSIALINSFYAAHYAIAPLTIGEQFAIDGLERLFELANMCMRNNDTLRGLKILINKFDKRVKYIEDYKEKLKEIYDSEYRFNTDIRIDASIERAFKCRTNVFLYNNKCKAAEDFSALADEVIALE